MDNSFQTQGALDARTLLAGLDEAALDRFVEHAENLACDTPDQTHAYLAGFRTVLDPHISAIESKAADVEDEGHITAFAGTEIDVFREGGHWVYYVDGREMLAYGVPSAK